MAKRKKRRPAGAASDMPILSCSGPPGGGRAALRLSPWAASAGPVSAPRSIMQPGPVELTPPGRVPSSLGLLCPAGAAPGPGLTVRRAGPGPGVPDPGAQNRPMLFPGFSRFSLRGNFARDNAPKNSPCAITPRPRSRLNVDSINPIFAWANPDQPINQPISDRNNPTSFAKTNNLTADFVKKSQNFRL